MNSKFDYFRDNYIYILTRTNMSQVWYVIVLLSYFAH